MKKIRIAIIGQGRSGRDIHAANLIHAPEKFEIVAIVDELEDRRQRAVKEHQVPVFSNYQELFNRKDTIDLVVNASFSQQHVAITKDLLEQGFNVLVEKPFAKTVAEADLLIETAKKNGVVLAVFQQSRYAPYFQEIKRIADSGVLGRLVQVSIAFNGYARRWDWQTLQRFTAGNLYNTGPHPMDQALQFLNYEGMPEIRCYMDRVNTFGDAEDYVKLLLSAPQRPVIDVEISSADAYPSFTYKLQGSNGGLVGTMETIEYKYFDPTQAPKQTLVMTPLMKDDGTPAYCGEALPWIEKTWTVPIEQKDLFRTITLTYYNMLYETLVNGAPLDVTLEQVRQQIAVIEECHKQNPLSKKY